MKNGVATAVTFTIAAGAGAATYSDLVNTVSYAAGDSLRINLQNNATGASATIGAMAFEFRAG